MRKTWDPTLPAIVAAVVMLAGTLAATGGISPGHWRGAIGPDPRSVRLDLRLVDRRGSSRLATDVAAAKLDGFDASAFALPGAPLRFAWKHDAGTFVFEGEGGRRPGGTVRFEPDAAFSDRWRELGLGTIDASDLLGMAVHDVRLEDALRLRAMGYDPVDADTLIRLGSDPGSMEWLEEIHAQGLRLDLDEAFRLRAHGVSSGAVRAFQEAGVRVDVDDLIRLNERGIDAGYLKAVTDAGVGTDDLDGILRLHAHGVSTDFVEGIRASGYPGVRVDDLVRLHDQGVEPAYVRGLVASRLPDLGVEDVVRLHAHGVPADYARAIVEIGPGRRDVDDVIRLHDHGVSADLVRKLAETGRRDLTVDDVIRASTRGPDSLR